MDKWGRLLPQPNKFPSAFTGAGFSPLSDYVHALGLKFGIHLMRVIPRQSVWAKSPVLGTDGITADMIANTSSICPWVILMYGLNMDKTAAQEYLNSLLKLYAEWEVYFIIIDDILRPFSAAEVVGYHTAIAGCKRWVVLSLSTGETSVKVADHARQQANFWRMADNFWDNCPMVLKMFSYAKILEGIGGAGHWPDCDKI